VGALKNMVAAPVGKPSVGLLVGWEWRRAMWSCAVRCDVMFLLFSFFPFFVSFLAGRLMSMVPNYLTSLLLGFLGVMGRDKGREGEGRMPCLLSSSSPLVDFSFLMD